MELILVTVTGVSLLLALAMGFLLFKAYTDERRRSAARVELLARAAGVPTDDEPSPAFVYEADDAFARGGAERDPGLFAAGAATPPWGSRLAVAAALLVVLTVAGYALLPGNDGGEHATAVPDAVAHAPLELVALSYTQRADALTISGVVQNPGAGAPVVQVAAVALVFGPDGAMVATGRAPLDYPRLGPGEESPFVIEVPVRGTVAKYRVGFRRADGSVLGHVDRRVEGSSARRERPAGGMPWDR